MGVVSLSIHASVNTDHYMFDTDIDVLTRIYDKQVNLAVYERDISHEINQFVRYMLEYETDFAFVKIIQPDQVKQELSKTLPKHFCRESFLEDLATICDMYAVLFDLEKIGFRLSVLTSAMCPRFHVDQIPCRLLSTYGDTGTEWLTEQNIDRNKLGRGNNGLPDNESGIYFDEEQICSLNPYDVALFKGESWPGNTDKGIVHRSPAITESNPRLLLSLDFV